ncbi:hypothetical protein HID58_042479, partial [Brassica napus]
PSSPPRQSSLLNVKEQNHCSSHYLSGPDHILDIDTFVRKQLETSGQYLEPVTSVWSKVVSIAEGLYARFSAASVFLGPYKAGSFFFVDTCNKNLDTFGDNHYYAQKVDTMHSLIKVHGDCC